MRRWLWAAIAAFFIAPLTAWGQGTLFSDDIMRPAAVIPGASVRVCQKAATGTPCSPLASIYSDEALTQLDADSIVTANAQGRFSFYAPAGCFLVQVSAAGFSTNTYTLCFPDSETSNPVAADNIRYVKNGGNDANNGLSWAAAEATFTDPLTSVPAAGRVIYANGSLIPASDLFAGITNPVHIIFMNGTLQANVNLTFPKNFTLEFRQGALLSAATGVTVTINGTLVAGNYRIFSLAGTGVINPRSPASGMLNANWWGARPIDPNTTPAAVGITATIAGTTTSATLSAASSFQNGDGVVIYGAGASHAMTTPGAPTVQPSVAAAGTGTGIVVNAPAGGGETYSYKIVARNKNGGLTAAGSAGVASLGFILGARSVTISTLSRSNAVVTVTTSTAHEMSVGSMVYIKGTSDNAGFGGWFMVDTVADTTHFTYTNGLDTRAGAATSATGGTANWFNCNRITWSAVTGAWQYYIYGRVSGSEVLIGVSRPQDAVVTDLTFDDFGSPMMDGIIFPPYVPSAPPGAATSAHLATTIVSGAGTTTLVLKDAAGTTVSGATIRYDTAPTILAAANAATNSNTLYFPSHVALSYVVNSYLTLSALTTFSVSQTGAFYLNETVEMPSNTRWYGFLLPQPTGAPTFGFEPGATITVNSANPGFYQGGRNSNSYYGLSFQGNANGSLLFLGDRLNDDTFDSVNFTTSTLSSDYMGIGVILRGTSTDSSFLNLFTRTTFTGGPSQTPGVSATPLMYCNFCGKTKFENISLSRRGIFYRPTNAGTHLQLSWGRLQGGITSFVTTYAAGSSIDGYLDIFDLELDTTAQALYANLSDAVNSNSANITIRSSNDPSSDAGTFPGLVTGRKIFNLKLQDTTAITGQNVDVSTEARSSLSIPTYSSTTTTNTTAPIGNLRFSKPTHFPAKHTLYWDLPPPTGVTATVAAGGSVPQPNTWTYKVTAVSVHGGESVPSAISTNCVTSVGNQTCNVAWSAVAGAASYNVYRSSGAAYSRANLSTHLTTTTYSDTSSFGLGTAMPTESGAGVIEVGPDTSGDYRIATPNIWVRPPADKTGIRLDAAATPTANLFEVYDSAAVLKGRITSAFLAEFDALTVLNNTLLKNLNGGVYASQFSGANAGAKIQAAINQQDTLGGLVIADFTGSQTISSQLTVKDGVNVFFYPALYTCSISPGFVSLGASAVDRVSNTVTVTVSNSFSAGQYVTLTNVTNPSFNGTWKIATASASNFTFSQTNPSYANATSGNGTAGLACIYMEEHTNLEGSGVGPGSAQGTFIQAGVNMNATVIFGQSQSGRAGFWQQSSIRNLRVDGNLANNTGGIGIEIHQLGEQVFLERIISINNANFGFRFNGILSGSSHIEDLFSSANGIGAGNGVGFDFYDVGSYIRGASIKGDDNTGPLIRFRPAAGFGGFSATLDLVHAESGVATNHDPIILIDSTNSITNLFITRLGAGGGGGLHADAIKNSGAGGSQPIITLFNAEIDNSGLGYTNLFNEATTGNVVNLTAVAPSGGRLTEWHYSQMPAIHSNAIATLGVNVTLVNGANQNVRLGENFSGGAGFIRIIGPTAAFNIGGFVSSTETAGSINFDGYLLTVFNSTSQALTINNEDASSTAQNRILTQTGANVVFPASTSLVSFIYSKADNRWILRSYANATLTSAELAARLTDETGTGLAVFATSPTLTTPVISSIVNTGTLTLPTTTDTLVGRDTTDVLTNKTIDEEATGNTITRIEELDLPAATCEASIATILWHTPVGTADTAPTAACNDTGSIQRPSADFSGSAVNSMEYTIRLPEGWSGNIQITLRYVTVAASPTGNVEWDISTVCRGPSESWDAAFNAVETITDAVIAQNQQNDATDFTLTTTGCSAGEDMTVKISRDGVNDTNNDLAKLLKIYFKLRHTK